jgi:hypothetical protein
MSRRTVVLPEYVDEAQDIHSGKRLNSGQITDLPAPSWDRNLEYSPGRTWVAKDEKLHPSIIRRGDVDEWVSPSIGWFRQALYDPRLDPNWMLHPNVIGNMAIVADDGKPDGSAWYIGYIDVVTGKVNLWSGDENDEQAMADNYPFSGAFLHYKP